MDTIQPQHLRITLLLGPLAGAVGGGVVTAALGLAGAATDGTDVLDRPPASLPEGGGICPANDGGSFMYTKRG